MHKNKHYLAFFISVLALAMIFQTSLKAQTKQNNFHINQHEALSNLVFTKKTAANVNKTQQATTLSFQAFGKQFDLELIPNQQLFANLPSTQKQKLSQDLQLYKGKLANTPGSWARINQQGNFLSGALWDGKELYMIDRSDKVAQALGNANTKQKPYTLVYKLSQTESTASCALDAKAKPLKSFQGLVKELQAHIKLAAQATRKLDLAVVTDAQFTQDNSANPQAAVMQRMNVVDGIFSEQVGVTINVSEIRNLASNGPLNSNEASNLLQQFSSYATSPGFNNPGLAHLMTNRNIIGNTVGIAYLGSLCDKTFGVGLSQSNEAGIASALIAAHEIGHNFGAPHDDEPGSACVGTPGSFLMNPFINGSKQFSACSLQQIAPNVAGASACLNNNTSTAVADVRPVIPINPINTKVSSNFRYRIEVFNSGSIPAKTVTTRIVLPTSLTVNSVRTIGQCSRSGRIITCKLGAIAANTTRVISISLKSGTAAATLVSTVRVAASNDSISTNNVAKAAIRVRKI